MTPAVTTSLGDFGAPPDAIAWAACGLALLFAVLAVWNPSALRRVPTRVVVGALAALAFVLSAGYVRYYLRGGPRIIDATSYYLEGRTFAAGHVAFPVPSPTGSFRGRFLLAPDGGRALSVIFPPGYPALLALGFAVGAPLLVGPLVAAALVVATYALARRLFEDGRIAVWAAVLSVSSAVLRYHTADTMSHGLAALLLSTTLVAASANARAAPFLAGLASGALVATRPVSGAVAVLLAALVLAPSRRGLVLLAAGAAGPVLLLLLEQRAATGAWLGSSQLAYYALADGPPGCFRYGFGAGVGCRFEHGDFVRAHLAHGYGFLAAAGTTLRRLKMHLADAGNVELFAPLLVFALGAALENARSRPAAWAVLGVVAAYVPFYFDGNYPGGGARLYADVLPVEHVLVAAALVRFGVAKWAPAVALLGFALHTSYDHVRLREREGGRPMFEAVALARAGVDHGLVFVDTDHGFDLGFDPTVETPRDGVIVARRRGDAHDAVLWDRLGRPPAFVYAFDPRARNAVANVAPLAFPEAGPARYEAEAEWPPLAVRAGWVLPVFPSCASAHRALLLNPRPGFRVRFEIAPSRSGNYRVRTGWVAAGAAAAPALYLAGRGWNVRAPTPVAGTCFSDEGPTLSLGPTEMLEITVDSPISVDFVELVPVR